MEKWWVLKYQSGWVVQPAQVMPNDLMRWPIVSGPFDNEDQASSWAEQEYPDEE